MFSVEFLRTPQDLGIAVIVLATDRLDALAKATKLFPEYRRYAARGHVYRVAYAEVDWEAGKTVIFKRRLRPPLPRLSTQSSPTRGEEGKEGEGGTDTLGGGAE